MISPAGVRRSPRHRPTVLRTCSPTLPGSVPRLQGRVFLVSECSRERQKLVPWVRRGETFFFFFFLQNPADLQLRPQLLVPFPRIQMVRPQQTCRPSLGTRVHGHS